MEKRALIALMIVFIMPVGVCAETGKVYLVNLHYKEGAFSLLGTEVKEGYAPDKNIQPEEGHEYMIISQKGDVLYSYKYALPDTEYYDRMDTQSGNLSGEVIKRSEFDHTLVIPYYGNAKRIDVYDPTGSKVLEIDVSKYSEKPAARDQNFLPAIAGMLFLIIAAYLILRRKK